MENILVQRLLASFTSSVYPAIMIYREFGLLSNTHEYIFIYFIFIFGGGSMIFYFSIVQVHFFGYLNFFVLFSFLIKYYHIMFIIILFWLGSEDVWASFFLARFASFHSHASLLTFFVCLLVLFHSCCSHARVFVKTFVHEFPISYSHTESYLLFSRNRNVEESPVKN